MAWPTGSVSTTHLDSPTDDPSQARADLKTAIDKLNEAIAALAQANGVASLDGAGKLPSTQLPDITDDKLEGITMRGKLLEWSSPGTYQWTVPAGVTKIRVRCFGAGGGGAYGATNPHGGGGGAGGWVEKWWTVVPGQTVNITIGAGGQGGASGGINAQGQPGEASSVTINGFSITGFGGVGGDVPAGKQGGSFSLSGLGEEFGNKGGVGGAATETRGGLGGSNAICGAGLTGAADQKGGGGGYGSGGTGGPGNDGVKGLVLIEY